MMKACVLLGVLTMSACGGGGGSGGKSNPESTPGSVSAVTVSGFGEDAAISWDSVAGADSYTVYYSTDATFEPENYSVFDDANMVVNADPPFSLPVEPGPEYYARVAAANSAGEGPASDLSLIITRYEIHPNDSSVVIDHATGLEWRRCSEGYSWSGQECEGSMGRFNRPDAMAYASREDGGWRVPSRDELLSIVFCERIVNPFPYVGSEGSACGQGVSYTLYDPVFRDAGIIDTPLFWMSHVYPDDTYATDYTTGMAAYPAGKGNYNHPDLGLGLRLVRTAASDSQ